VNFEILKIKLFGIVFQVVFLKNINILCLNYFFIFLDYFNVLILKIIF
jgi:hypothetical protein